MRLTTIWVGTVVLGVLLVGVADISAAIYYVDQRNPLASDSNPGTAGLPFLTITKATKTAVAGDTVIVRRGIYREAPSFTNSGSDGNPITLKGQPGERVVVSGADAIASWTQCTPAIAKGNANYANIYYVDLTWQPTQLYQDEQLLDVAREPNIGWWIAGGGTTSTMIDATNLTQSSGFWTGARIFLWDVSITAQYTKDIIDFDSSTDTITISGVWNSTIVPEAGKDRYYLMNKVEILDREGEWAWEPINGGTAYRVYFWPIGSSRPDGHLIEGARRARFIIELGSKSYWVIDGLELRNGQAHGFGGYASTCLGHNTVQNCTIHDNAGTGIYGRYMDDSVYRNNFVGFNGDGISNVGAPGCLVEENEICWNSGDGLLMTGLNNPADYSLGGIIRRNYIHDHWRWGHPDNVQSYNYIRDLVIEDNLIFSSGQSHMVEEATGFVYRNNVMIGSLAYMIILGHSNTFDTTIEHNTLFFPGYGTMSNTGDGYDFHDNIFVEGHKSSMWGGVGAASTYASDYNLFYHGPTIASTTPCVIYDSHWSWTFDDYVDGSGQDTHSVYADPQFANVPVSYHPLNSAKQMDFLPNRVYLRETGDMSLLAVGDVIELDWDGVTRTITAKGSDWVEFSPPDARVQFKSGSLINWKTNTNLTLDFTLGPSSPARGTASDGANKGSSIDVQDYMACDFDGDGTRDVPVWPLAVSTLTAWQTVAAAQPASAGEGTVDPRAVGVGQLRLLFDHPLDASTAVPSAITIVGASSGNVSGLVTGVALDDSDQTIVVTLSASLPDADTYLITASPSLAASDQGPTRGVKSIQVSALAGDADGSGTVDQADVVAVRSHLGQLVTPDNARYDIDADGVISARDMKLVRKFLGHSLP